MIEARLSLFLLRGGAQKNAHRLRALESMGKINRGVVPL